MQATLPEGEIAIGLHVSGSAVATVATGSSLRADLTSPSVPGAGAAMVASKLLGTRLVYIRDIYICTRPCHPPPPSWDGSHILAPYEIFPLPPCGVVGVWHCPPPPPVVWWMGPIYWSHMRSSPSPPCGVVGVWHCPPPPPVVWWGCGMVCWVCMVCMVGLVWHVWKVWYVWYVW